MKRRLLLVLVGVLCICVVRVQAQGANFTGAQDTVRLSLFGTGVISSVFSMNQNVQRFNDTMSKQGYGRFASTAIGISLGYSTRLSDDFIGFQNIFATVNLPPVSNTYTSWLWRFGIETTIAYILLKNDVFRLYPLGGVSVFYQLLTLQEQATTTPAMLNSTQFREPWRIALTSIGVSYFAGVGADVRWENPYNRVYELETGTFQMDMRIGLHLCYNFGIPFLNDSPTTIHWSANGAGVRGLASILPQGLSLKLLFIQEMVKIK
jgi:hypothetical protein